MLGVVALPRVAAPEFDAAGAAKEAMSLYDSNSDGQLDDGELKACMALGRAIDEIDTDSDGQISEDEIEARVEFFIQGRVGRESLMCRIVKRNSPIPGATVTFVPEPFMADMIESASGETNFNGEAVINIDDKMGGIQPGFYKVEDLQANCWRQRNDEEKVTTKKPSSARKSRLDRSNCRKDSSSR